MADPEWLWADPIVLNFNRVSAFKEVNACQWRAQTNEMYVSLVRTRLVHSYHGSGKYLKVLGFTEQ